MDVRFVVVRRSLLGRACRPSRRQARSDGVQHATAVVPNFETVRTSRRTGFEPRMAVARVAPPFREQQAAIRIASVGLQPPAGHPPRPATHPDRPFERSNGRGGGISSVRSVSVWNSPWTPGMCWMKGGIAKASPSRHGSKRGRHTTLQTHPSTRRGRAREDR